MAKKADRNPTSPLADGRRARAKAAVDALIESVHEDNRVLEGEELVKAVCEIFKIVRPLTTYKGPK
jgi:hypothetical protein